MPCRTSTTNIAAWDRSKVTQTFLDSDPRDESDRLCIHLFDRFCERRSVILLDYLMLAWPIVADTEIARTRLHSHLQELLQFHPDTLTREDYQVIAQILAIPTYELSGSVSAVGKGEFEQILNF